MLVYNVICFFPMQELTLQGLVSGVEVSVVGAESLKVEDSLVHKCTFPVRELLGTRLKLKHKNLKCLSWV